MSNSLKRAYLFSDTFGDGVSARAPKKGGLDSDALIATDFRARRFLFDKSWREFDTLKSDFPITDHILRHIDRLHAQMESCLHGDQLRELGITGVMINSAPRVDQKENGAPFYLATLRDGRIRVVAPAHALSPVKDRIHQLAVLPNENNGLFPDDEQFRSSYAPYLLQPDHDVDLQSADTSVIPDQTRDWRVAYIDRFGNIVTFDNRFSDEREAVLEGVRLQIGSALHSGSQQDVLFAHSLRGAVPGKLSLYGNDGNRDVARKWTAQEKSWRKKLSVSAYRAFGRPEIGDSVSIVG